LVIKGWAAYFEYFTQWNFTLLCVYFWIVCYFSLKKLNFFKLWKSRINIVEEYFAIFAWILFHMEIVCAFFIDIVVWGILFPWAMAYDHKNHTHSERQPHQCGQYQLSCNQLRNDGDRICSE